MVIRPKGVTEAHLKEANIGQDYWEVDFSNYEGPDNAKAVTVRYLHNLKEMKDQGIGLMYAGPYGPGKTTLAMIAFKYLVRANWVVFTTSLGEIVERIQKSWGERADAEAETFLDRARVADFLFIDDVGKEHRGGSGFTQTIFDNLIRYRIQHRLPTFLTTNHTKSELAGIYGESVISLLEGKTRIVVVNGKDYRRTKQKLDVKEAFREAKSGRMD